MGSQKSLNLCYPRGAPRVVCLCDIHRRFLRCWSESNAPKDLGSVDDFPISKGSEALLSNDFALDDADFGDVDGIDDFGRRRAKGLDERTEIILAATFLVLVILAFVSFVIYRCEKNYMRRRLQESFHISQSGGLLTSASAHHNGPVPSISVSVQTEPPIYANGHLSNTAAFLNGSAAAVPGRFQPHHHQNGTVPPSYSTSTLPHSAHLKHHHQTQSGTTSANTESTGDGSGIPPPPLPPANGSNGGDGTGGGPQQRASIVGVVGSSMWGREIHAAQSFRDVRDGIMTLTAAAAISHSRDNTLSRDAANHHHLNNHRGDEVGLAGLRSSCTQENLRSPSVLGGGGNGSNATNRMSSGNNNDVDDDINTDYAESDVMLGGSGGSGSAGSSGVASAASGSGGGPHGGHVQRF